VATFTALVVQILHHVHAALLPHFWRLWISLTGLAAISVAWAVRPGATSTSRGERPLVPAQQPRVTPKGIAMLALLAVFLAAYIALMLAWESFAYYDNDFFTLGTLI
jgi:hypothetical protein